MISQRELALVSQSLATQSNTDKNAYVTRFTSLIEDEGSKGKVTVKDRLEVTKAICRTLCESQSSNLPQPSLDPADVILVHENDAVGA